MDSNEKWLPAPGYEGYYEVSNKGRIKTAAIFIRHDGNWSEEGGYVKKIRLRSQNTNRYGYKTIKMCKLGKCKQCLVHRLVALAFIPNDNPRNQINHIDGDKTNNSVENLEWVSAAENMRHAWRTGLVTAEHLTGSNHHAAKLTEKEVAEIRTLYHDKKHTQDELCAMYGIKKGTLKDILYYRTWKNVP